MPFLTHLEELRRALLRSFLAFLAATVLCLFFSPQLFHWLQEPLLPLLPERSYFITTSPFEFYLAYLKTAMTFGLLLASPFVFYFLWHFIHPGLKNEEKRWVVVLALGCGLLFAGGALFGYFVVFPVGFHFIVDMLKDTGIVFLPKVSDYLSFCLRLLLAFGLIFELPLFLFLLGRLGLVHAQQLRGSRKYVLILILIVAGVLTPGPDVISQILMALPLIILFELGILLVPKNPPNQSGT
jgi:sec-independent protein translocase protein TatC